MLSSTESELKAKATKYFQEFRMDEAIDYYNRALKQANSDTCVLNSNISACYFEKGEYQTCIDYSKKVLDDAAVALNPKILEKNKARICKCEALLKDNCKDQTGINESDWLEKINLLERYRPMLETDVFEYFPIGHDKVTSALEGKIGSNGKEQIKSDSSRLDLNQMSSEELASINIFFGGSGDCRHVYTTIEDLYRQLIKLPVKKQKTVKSLFVVNDLKPHALAKMLIILKALRKLGDFEIEQIGKDVEATTIAAVLMYLFGMYLMPDYIANEVDGIIKDIVKSDLLTDEWEFMAGRDQPSWLATKKVLEQWLTKCPVTVEKILLKEVKDVMSDMDTMNFDVSEFSMYFEPALKWRQSLVTMFQMNVNKDDTLLTFLKSFIFVDIDPESTSDAVLAHLNNLKPNDLFKVFIKFNELTDIQKKPFDAQEISFYKNNRFLMPPVLIQSNVEKELSKNIKAIKAHVKKNWKTNVTMIDYDWYTKSGDLDFYVEFIVDKILEDLFPEASKNKENQKKEKSRAGTNTMLQRNGKSLFDWFSLYFHNTAKAFKYLTVEKDTLKVDIRTGDVHEILYGYHIKEKKQQNQEIHSLNKFDRIFMSNIPDYTSLLAAFVDCMPVLKQTSKSYFKSNCLLNTGLWKDYNHYIFSGTSMPSVKECEAFLNATAHNTDLWAPYTMWSHKSLEFKPELNSRVEIFSWLSRVLLSVGFPTQRNHMDTFRESEAPNLCIVFRSIMHLITLGYPRHWFQAFLDSVLSNNLITNAQAPVSSPKTYVTSLTYKQVDISAILMELQTLASIYNPVLNLGLDSANIKPLQDICQYEIEFRMRCDIFDNQNKMPFRNVVGLIFEDPLCIKTNTNSADLFRNMFSGASKDPLRGKVLKNNEKKQRHLYSACAYYSKANKARFLMCANDFTSLMKLNWHVSLIRTDSWMPVSEAMNIKDACKISQLFN